MLAVVAFFIVFTASAHAVFIETMLTGTKGKSHAVKVVYGEPDEHEAIGKWWWYKTGEEVVLTLIAPDGSKEHLPTTAHGNHLLATFVPKQDGVYHVSFEKDTDYKEGAKTHFQINATASIQVGKSNLGNKAAALDNELLVYTDQSTLKNKKEVSLTLYQNGVPAPHSFFQVIAPSGWIKWVETDDHGVACFVPEWTGKYFVEVSKREKVQGQSFEEISRATSMSFEVK